MNNENINEDVFEQYTDATVALFMEYYSATLSENIRSEIMEKDHENIIFPEELDNRCRALIKKECARNRRKQYLKAAIKGLCHVATLVFVLLSLFCLLFMTVEAIRVPIINYFIEHSNGYWQIVGQEDSNQDYYEENIDMADPLAGLISEDYHLIVVEGNSFERLTAIYEADSGKQIFFSASSSSHKITIDSEDAQLSQEIQLLGCKGVLVAKDGAISLAWIYDKASVSFTLIADEMTETEAVSIAEQFMRIVLK